LIVPAYLTAKLAIGGFYNHRRLSYNRHLQPIFIGLSVIMGHIATLSGLRKISG